MPENTPSDVTNWEPFAEFDVFKNWPRLAGIAPMSSRLRERAAPWSPAMNITENDDRFVITMELAGANKDDVTIETHDNVLTLRGEKRSEREEENEQQRYVERSFGAFSRSFTLPSNADANSVEATFTDGVLTVEIAKREDTKPRTISVR